MIKLRFCGEHEHTNLKDLLDNPVTLEKQSKLEQLQSKFKKAQIIFSSFCRRRCLSSLLIQITALESNSLACYGANFTISKKKKTTGKRSNMSHMRPLYNRRSRDSALRSSVRLARVTSVRTEGHGLDAWGKGGE